MKSEIESCVGNVTVQDIKLVQRHCTKQKACTATLYKTKLQYVQVSTKQGVTYSRRGWHEDSGLKDWPKVNRGHTGSATDARWERPATSDATLSPPTTERSDGNSNRKHKGWSQTALREVKGFKWHGLYERIDDQRDGWAETVESKEKNWNVASTNH